MTDRNPLVYVITVVTYDMPWLTNYWSSLINTKYDNFKVLIIDNNSRDGSLELLRKYSVSYKNLEIIHNKRNCGIARANNIGVKFAISKGAEYIVLLNPDTKVDPYWLSYLVQAANSYEETGALSPFQYNYDGKYLDPTFLTTFEGNKGILEDIERKLFKHKYDVNIGMSAAILIKKDIFSIVGFFDELYFIYGDEYDFFRRMVNKGYKIYVIPKSKIYHRSSITHIDTMSQRAKFYYQRGKFLYCLKDPTKSYWNIFLTYIKEVAFIIKSNNRDLLSDINYFLTFISVQFWIFLHLPLIFISRNRDMHY